MSAVFEPLPLPPADPTAGLELTTGDEIALEAPRHVFLAANLLDPARQRDVAIQMPYGGDDNGNVCLKRTGGLIPRCRIVPVEVWGEQLPLELFPEGVRGLIIKGTQPPAAGEQLDANRRPFFLNNKPVYFYPHYPGQMIVDIVAFERRGNVELETLRGVAPGPETESLQALFFPDDYRVPVELRLIEQRIETVAESVADSDARTVADDMLLSVTMCREYMNGVVDLANTQLAERVSFQHTHRLTPKLRSFMAQLELQVPRQAIGERITDQVQTAVTSAISPAVMEQMQARDEAFVERIGTTVAVAVAEALRGVFAVPSPPVADTTDALKGKPSTK